MPGFVPRVDFAVVSSYFRDESTARVRWTVSLPPFPSMGRGELWAVLVVLFLSAGVPASLPNVRTGPLLPLFGFDSIRLESTRFDLTRLGSTLPVSQAASPRQWDPTPAPSGVLDSHRPLPGVIWSVRLVSFSRLFFPSLFLPIGQRDPTPDRSGVSDGHRPLTACVSSA